MAEGSSSRRHAFCFAGMCVPGQRRFSMLRLPNSVFPAVLSPAANPLCMLWCRCVPVQVVGCTGVCAGQSEAGCPAWSRQAVGTFSARGNMQGRT